IQLGHADIDYSNIGAGALGFFESFAARNGFIDNMPFGLVLENGAQPAAHNFVIVGNQNLNLHYWSSRNGRIAVIVVPRSLDPIFSCPPNWLARSRMPAIPTPMLAPSLMRSRVSGGTPRPASVICSRTCFGSRTIR